MGITNLLGLARDALTAQGFGLDVTGQNIANANTPGYVKRTAMLETRVAGTITYGGVGVTGIARSTDRFLDARANEAGSFSASAKSRDGALSQIEALFNDSTGTGLNDSVEALFGSFSSLATNPNDPTARVATLASADNFAARINQTAGQLTAQRADIITQAQATAVQVTETAAQIAKLNAKISEAEIGGADGSDLRDQRDKLVGDLSQKINIHVFTDGAGKLVISAAGATLVEGNNAAGMAVTTSASGAMQIQVQRSNGTTFDVTAQTNAGTLGGLREARETDLVAASQKLDQFAYDVATAVNTQHAAGVGLDNVGARNLFTVSGPTGAAASIKLNAAMIGHPEYVAAASSSAELPSGSTNAIALARLADGNVATGNTRTPIEAYSDLVGDIGQRKMAAAQNVNLRSAIFSQAQSMRESVSGVSMDEEMISLSRYQRAYEAASKLFRTADELLANLIREI
ncbi:MAG TPA: flagellar hook-associated protein FlgK [Polyangiaceae bacterium]|nr:flagellar hook-associated protein FlgK [Polyangiaceae bacterium]